MSLSRTSEMKENLTLFSLLRVDGGEDDVNTESDSVSSLDTS